MRNPKVVFLSIIAIICVILTFLVDWLFIIPAAVIVAYNWKALIS